MLAIITPSTARPHCFRLLERMVRRMDRHDWAWLVAGEDHTGYQFTLGQTVIRTKPVVGQHSIVTNLTALLERVDSDRIAVLEDDDWYFLGWLSLCDNALDEVDLFGLSRAWYYYWLPERGYFQHCNEFAVLASTAMRACVLPTLLASLRRRPESPYHDSRLWSTYTGSKRLKGSDCEHIGMKGLNDISCERHRNRRAVPDTDGAWLRAKIGHEAEWYRQLPTRAS